MKTISRRLSSLSSVKETFSNYVMPTYARYDIVLDRGQGSYVYGIDGTKYLDAGGGIAVNSLGHAHPEVVKTISQQASKLMHCSNLYYTESQGDLAKRLTQLFGSGKVFFSNSGAEANEGMFKLARANGISRGRYKIITTINSFHGRTLAGISATGQEKIKKGFYPMVQGFSHVPFNDLQAMEQAIDSETAAILIEGIQGEGGVTPATPEYLLGLRKLCDKHGILLMMDGVQCGHFRSGKFQSYQRILENEPAGSSFMPDVVSMAKSLGAGFPIGAFWARKPYADTLAAGMHGTTYGGNPLACSVALTVLDVIKKERLDENAMELGKYIADTLTNDIAVRYPQVIAGVRGLGFMLGIRVHDANQISKFDKEKPPAGQLVNLMHEQKVLAVPAGTHIIRILPPLNFSKTEADELLHKFEAAVKKASQ